MLAIIVGLVFIILGVWGMAAWWNDFVLVLRGLLPPLLVCGGLLALIAGVSSLRESSEPREVIGENEEK